MANSGRFLLTGGDTGSSMVIDNGNEIIGDTFDAAMKSLESSVGSN